VTISRGQVLVADGQFRGAAGHGAFLSRGLNQYLV
jgi:dihydropyrimidinase